MHPHKKMGGSKESQDQHETERRESLPAQANPLLLIFVRCHSKNTTVQQLAVSLFQLTCFYIFLSSYKSSND